MIRRTPQPNSPSASAEHPDPDTSRRERIITAASALLTEYGYATTSTLDIANRARVSKRELYRLFDNKQAILAACIERRVTQIRTPLAQARPADPASLAASLLTFGGAILRELSDPSVVAMYKLAASETVGSPEIADELDRAGHTATRQALVRLLTQAQEMGAIGPGDATAMAAEFFGLLWGDLQVRLILGVAGRPTTRGRNRRAQAATDALFRLHPAAGRSHQLRES